MNILCIRSNKVLIYIYDTNNLDLCLFSLLSSPSPSSSAPPSLCRSLRVAYCGGRSCLRVLPCHTHKRIHLTPSRTFSSPSFSRVNSSSFIALMCPRSPFYTVKELKYSQNKPLAATFLRSIILKWESASRSPVLAQMYKNG